MKFVIKVANLDIQSEQIFLKMLKELCTNYFVQQPLQKIYRYSLLFWLIYHPCKDRDTVSVTDDKEERAVTAHFLFL